MSSSVNILPLPEHDEIYAKIKAYYLAKSVPQNNPRAVITGGQPGSGKSRLTSDAASEFSTQGGYVLVDADKLRRFHPHYSNLLMTDDTSAANYTHPDASGWARKLRRAGQDGRRNLIIDQTSKDPVVLVSLANQLRSDGYTVDLRVIAVSNIISEQRIYARYEQQKSTDGYGRFATKDTHDLAYTSLPDSVESVELNKCVDSIMLFDKNHRLIYSNTLLSRGWSNAPKGKEVLIQERNRPLSRLEIDEYIVGYEKLIFLLTKRGADQNSVSYINKLLSNAKNLHESDKTTATNIKQMKHRLLVMNGQKLLQVENKGQWDVVKVDKAGSLKPGIYNIHLATQADKAKSYDGVVLHSDKEFVYQKVGNNYIKHNCNNFDKLPNYGDSFSIKYNGEKVIISASSISQRRGLSR